MDYNWRDDIYDVIENDLRDREECDELFFEAAKKIVEDNLEDDPDYYNDPDDAVYEEASDIIHLWAIPFYSTLYDLLVDFLGGEDAVLENARNSFTDNDYLYFVSGTGYDIMSADLLGGKADGIASREFDDFVRAADADDYPIYD